jgi:hypothetical protein
MEKIHHRRAHHVVVIDDQHIHAGKIDAGIAMGFHGFPVRQIAR